MKRILLLNGNPKQRSFNQSLCDTYQQQAERSATVRRFNLSEMNFNPNLSDGYELVQPLEPCLSEFTKALLWSDHIIISAPVWWGGLPGKLKGLIDRVFLPGITFRFEEGCDYPIPLLTGKTARIILTMDTPHELSEQQAQPVLEQLGRYTLEFCGVATPEYTLLGSVHLSEREQKQDWLNTVKALGAAGH